MAKFEITAPDGRKYHVEGATADGALAALRKMLGEPQGTTRNAGDGPQVSAGPFAVPAPPDQATAPPATAKGGGNGKVILNINGTRVSVSDTFLSLSPDEQNRAVDEIAAGIGAAKPASSGLTEAQLKEAARKAYAAGDLPAAKRLIDAARKVGNMAVAPAASAPSPEMADPTMKPWEKYGASKAAAKPWEKYGGQAGNSDGQSPELTSGLASLSAMTQNPVAALRAERARNRTTWDAIKDNVIGDPTDGVDSYGEQAGRLLKDAGSAAAAGLARGTASIVGLPGTVGDLFNQGMTAGGKAIGIIPEDWVAPSNSLSGASLTEGMSGLTGGATDYRGDSRAAKFVGTAAEFIPGALAFGGASPSNLIKYGVMPGVTSEAAGQATEGTAFEPYARAIGALAGGVLPDILKKGAAKLISPYGGADPERLKLASVLDDFGVPISAGQRVGNEALRRKEGLTGAGQSLNEAQREAFTRAALKTAGTDAARATPEVLEETAKRIGSVFDDVTRGVDVTPDPDSLTALSGAVDTYKSLAPTGNQAPLVSNIFKDVTKAFRGGNAIPASTVNTWRSGLSKLTASADAATREAAQQALETIDDMLTASLNAAGRADDVARLATARGEWRNFLAIQKAATGAGESAAAGLLSPAQLRSAVRQQGISAFAQGRRGDIGALARAGVGVMDSLPNSGTPAGIRAMLPTGLSSGLGATIGSSIGPWGTAGGAALGALMPGLAGAVRMSGPVQSYLANQILPQAATNIPKGAGLSILPFMSGL